MKLKMFTLYDSKAETYLRPFSMMSTGEAIRGFNTTLNDFSTEMGKYPADFTLFEIGTFDDQTAILEISPSMKNLGNGIHVKAMHNPGSEPPFILNQVIDAEKKMKKKKMPEQGAY